VSAVCLGAVAAVGVVVRPHPPEVDAWLHEFALTHRDGSVLRFAGAVTQGGSSLVAWPMIAVAALVFPRSRGARRWVTAGVVAAGAGSGIGVRLALSELVHRARPPLSDWATVAGGYAYPSGHTGTATLSAGVLAWAVSRHLQPGPARVAVWAVAVGYAGAVGWSRVWLGVHWPSDVLAGWLLGAGWLAGVAAVTGSCPGRLDWRTRPGSLRSGPVDAHGRRPGRDETRGGVNRSDDTEPPAVPAQAWVARTHCPDCSTPLDPPALRPGEVSDLGYAQVLQQRCPGCDWLHVHVRWRT